MYQNNFPIWQEPHQPIITQSYTYVPTETTLKQGYFLNKNMNLEKVEKDVYIFTTSNKVITVRFESLIHKLIVFLEGRIIFEGKIKTEKELEVLLGQLNVKL